MLYFLCRLAPIERLRQVRRIINVKVETMRADIKSLLEQATEAEQREVLAHLRNTYPVHPLEKLWHAPAEMILDAISESTDLTQRGVKGVIADRAFHKLVVPTLETSDWRPTTVVGDLPYDALLVKDGRQVSVQVKMQRKVSGRPMERILGGKAYWIAEVQRTRSGQNADGTSTRPYSFGSFDILAVNLYASSNDWSRFAYTLERWLLPRKDDDKLIAVLQPVAKAPNADWTFDFEECVQWLHSDVQKRIAM